MHDKSNIDLVQLLKQGDKVAFYRLYALYSRRLYGFVLQYVKQDEDAEEIIQDIFIKIWEQKENINPDLSFESYLFTMANNAAVSLIRKRITETKYLDYLKSIQQVDSFFDLTDELYSNELADKMDRLLNEVTPRQKEIFELSRYEGMSNVKIAEKLNISVNTVKKHLANAILFLKQNTDK